MAPLIDTEKGRALEMAVADYSPLEMLHSSTSVLIVSIVIFLSAIFTLMMCGCCKNDNEKKRMLEEADANVPPPPMADSSERSQISKREPTPGYASLGLNEKPGTVKKASQKDPKALVPIPKGEAHDYMTMALANSVVFDKPDGKTGKKPPPPKPAATGPIGPATLALADSKVFDKQGGSKKPTPSASGDAPLATLAFADSKVFDKK